ncbi:derriere protein-like protein [Pitangus sulphuratus]|nr:derriere protein-like protein [Pitangus sulphuratus]
MDLLLLQGWCSEPFGEWCNLQPKDAAKMPESAWKLLFYSLSWSYGAYLLFFTDYPFFHDPPSVFYGWKKGMDVPTDIAIAYLLQCSFYGHSIYATAYMDTWRKDSVVMLLHHVVTLTLIASSYAFRYHNVGILVLFLHDINDVQLEFTKLNVYFKHRGGVYHRLNDVISNVGCLAFSVSWFWFRLYWFPLKVLYATCYSSLQAVPNIPFYFFFNALLLILTLMNIYWFLYIVLFVAKVLMGQMQEVNDVREYDVEDTGKAARARKKEAGIQLPKALKEGLAWALLGPVLGTELSVQESLLLKSLGLSAKPSPKSPVPVPPVLWRIFQKRKTPPPADKEPLDACRVEEFNVPGNIIRVLTDQGLESEPWEADPAQPEGPTTPTSISPSLSGPFIAEEQPQGWLCLRKRLLFNLSVLEEGERLTMARLEIKFHHNSYHPSRQGQVLELRLLRAPQTSLPGVPQRGQRLLLEQSLAQLHKSLLFDLSVAAQAGRASGGSLGLILEISAGEGAPRSPCSGVDSFLDASLLVVTLSPQCQAPERRRRRRRSALHPPLTPSNLCRARRLHISFSDVGWENWIIAPQGYLANYCRGECPFPLTAELNSTNHAVLQTMVHSLDPQGTPQPCCVPVRLSPISILYYDNSDNVVLRHYEDMVVDECGCR